MYKQITFFFIGMGCIVPMLSFAAVSPASIVTRPGIATAPLKYYFDLAPALTDGINHAIKVTVTASNSEKTAVRFDSVRLFGADGATVGNNVASKTDALAATPYNFVFQNFGVSADDLKKVAGVQITFLDLGGENPSGKVTVSGVAISLDRNLGGSCIIADPFIDPLKPVITVKEIQQERKIIAYSGGGGGSCSPTSSGPNSPATIVDETSVGSITWGAPGQAATSDDLYAVTVSASTGTMHYLKATNFSFSIPSGATIDGITLEIEKKRTQGGAIADAAVRIVKGGTIGTTDKSNGSAWPGADAYTTYGSSSDKWGETWTASDINGSTFGAALSATLSGSPPIQINVDHFRITVNYTATGCASVYDSFMDLVRTVSKKISCRITPSSTCKK